MIGKAYDYNGSSYYISHQTSQLSAVLDSDNHIARKVVGENFSWGNSASYAVMISAEAKLMVTAEKKNAGNIAQGEPDTHLIVGSLEEKERLLSALRKGSDGKAVNEVLQKFCEENGIDTDLSPTELESYVVVADTDEMKRKSVMDTLKWDIQFDLNGLLDPFHNGRLEGPSDYVYRMFEERLGKYAKDLNEYVENFGTSEELQRRINKFLADNNKDGSNQVAQLLKEITDKIFAGKTDRIDKLIEIKAEEVFNATFKNEIQASRQAESKKRKKFMDQRKKENELIERQREVLEDKIKALREQLLELRKKQGGDQGDTDQIKLLEKQLEEMETKLNKLRTDFSLPPEINYKETNVSVFDWISDSLDNSAFTE